VRQRSKANTFLQKFRWAVTDKSHLENVISNLKECNDGLYHLLSSAERRRLRRALPPEIVTTDQPEELAELQQVSNDCELLPNIVALKRHNLAFHSTSTEPRRMDTDSMALASQNLQIPAHRISQSSVGAELGQKRYMAKYDDGIEGGGVRTQSVLVEWKYYDGDANEAARVSQERRIESLARLLNIASKPQGLCVPLCLGYISDHWNFRTGLVFDCSLPSDAPLLPPACLFDRLKSKEVPALGDRFKLALDLAISLSILHTSGWVHKQLCSQNILFFPQIGVHANSSRQVQTPGIIGFEYSRPDDTLALTEFVKGDHEANLYRHPDTQGPDRKRFCRAFDIYSLGIVLLEIGYWRRISEFWKPAYTPVTFRHDLRSFHAVRLGPKTGKIYADVVASCLGGDLSEAGVLDDVESQRTFYWSVVNELSRLVA
jgi:hypothetical protein